MREGKVYTLCVGSYGKGRPIILIYVGSVELFIMIHVGRVSSCVLIYEEREGLHFVCLFIWERKTYYIDICGKCRTVSIDPCGKGRSVGALIRLGRKDLCAFFYVGRADRFIMILREEQICLY